MLANFDTSNVFRGTKDILAAAGVVGQNGEYLYRGLIKSFTYEKAPLFWKKMEMLITGKLFYSVDKHNCYKEGYDKSFTLIEKDPDHYAGGYSNWIGHKKRLAICRAQGISNLGLKLSMIKEVDKPYVYSTTVKDNVQEKVQKKVKKKKEEPQTTEGLSEDIQLENKEPSEEQEKDAGDST